MKKKINTILLTFFLCVQSVQISNAQWVQVSNGMGNLTIVALAHSGNNLYAGTFAFGVYLSTNNGSSIELSEIRPFIAKIILGPKVECAEEWAASFYYSLNENGYVPSILISHLPFK